jgi:hypothetical protein
VDDRFLIEEIHCCHDALGHNDTRMVEKHYGHLAPSFIADAIRAGAPRYRDRDRKLR